MVCFFPPFHLVVSLVFKPQPVWAPTATDKAPQGSSKGLECFKCMEDKGWFAPNRPNSSWHPHHGWQVRGGAPCSLPAPMPRPAAPSLLLAVLFGPRHLPALGEAGSGEGSPYQVLWFLETALLIYAGYILLNFKNISQASLYPLCSVVP